jgi:U3 small nucleolar RNA-associated protein 14
LYQLHCNFCIAEADAPKVRAFVSLPGWGSWAGAGCVDKYKDTLEARHNARVEQARSKAAAAREDSGKAHVILNEKRNKKSVKYLIP